jgi:D-sedoheptulose 7-phosphate isomerase
MSMSTSATTLPNRRRTVGTSKPIELSRSEGYLQVVSSTLKRLPFAMIDQLTEVLWNAYQGNRSVYLFGNGGSAALASHCACDLGKGTVVNEQRRFRVLALTDNIPLMTAWANDAGYEDVFAEQLRSFLQRGDVAFAISGSGNSPNVLNGLRVASELGAVTVGLTGFQGGKMKPLCEICIVVPSENMQVVEDAHLSVAHSIFSSLRERIAESSSQNLAEAVSGRCSS